jgi:hypothetical protein
MKNYVFLVWMSVIIVLCVSTYNFCMEVESSVHNYFAECKKINAQHNKELKDFITHITDDNASERSYQIRCKLQAHSNDIMRQKETVFSAIKKKHSIDDSLWVSCLTISQALQAYREKNMWQAHNDVVHCEMVPQWFMHMLKKELVDIGFNPQQTDIYHSEEISMVTVQTQIDWHCSNEKILINFTGPGKIGLNCNELDASYPDVEEGRCMLLAHMMKFSEISNILPILRTFGVPIDTEDEIAFVTLAWQQALFAIAFKSRSAHYIKSYCGRLMLSFCSMENYKLLSFIELCWRILKWLKKYSGNIYHGIPLFLKSKDGDATVVRNLLDSGMIVTKKTIEGVRDESPVKLLLQKTYDEQQCCVCKQHPEDMRDIPCNNEFLKDFICRQCYNSLDQNMFHQKVCPLCQCGCFSYNTITL